MLCCATGGAVSSVLGTSAWALGVGGAESLPSAFGKARGVRGRRGDGGEAFTSVGGQQEDIRWYPQQPFGDSDSRRDHCVLAWRQPLRPGLLRTAVIT
jgi:hypothetical protein